MLFLRHCGLALLAIAVPVMGQTSQSLELKVSAEGMETVDDSLTVRAQVLNLSEHRVVVTKMELEIPSSVVAGSRKTIVQFADSQFELAPKEAAERKAEVVAVPLRQAWALLLFWSKGKDASVFVEYDTAPSTGRQTSRADVTFQPLAPWWAVVAGGILGVPLMLTFRFLYQKSRGLALSTRLRWDLFLGWLAITLAVVAFRFISVGIPQFPLYVHVKDFWGGILLGLLFNQVVSWLGRVLLDQTNDGNAADAGSVRA